MVTDVVVVLSKQFSFFNIKEPQLAYLLLVDYQYYTL